MNRLRRLWSGTIPEAEAHAALDATYHAPVTERVAFRAGLRAALVGDEDFYEWAREVAW